jgi:hypothetical protein
MEQIKYLFNALYTLEEYARLKSEPYMDLITAYFVELVNDLINEVNEISEHDTDVCMQDVQEYITNQMEFDRDNILTDVRGIIPHDVEITDDSIMTIGYMTRDNLLIQYETSQYQS